MLDYVLLEIDFAQNMETNKEIVVAYCNIMRILITSVFFLNNRAIINRNIL